MKEACSALDNAARRNRQNYDYKFQKLMKHKKLIKQKSLAIILHPVVQMFKELEK